MVAATENSVRAEDKDFGYDYSPYRKSRKIGKAGQCAYLELRLESVTPAGTGGYDRHLYSDHQGNTVLYHSSRNLPGSVGEYLCVSMLVAGHMGDERFGNFWTVATSVRPLAGPTKTPRFPNGLGDSFASNSVLPVVASGNAPENSPEKITDNIQKKAPYLAAKFVEFEHRLYYCGENYASMSKEDADVLLEAGFKRSLRRNFSDAAGHKLPKATMRHDLDRRPLKCVSRRCATDLEAYIEVRGQEIEEIKNSGGPKQMDFFFMADENVTPPSHAEVIARAARLVATRSRGLPSL